jgi:hypothetical protein
MLLSAEKDLSLDTAVQNLDLVLRVLPEDVLADQVIFPPEQWQIASPSTIGTLEMPGNGQVPFENGQDYTAFTATGGDDAEDASTGSVDDAVSVF